MDGTMELKDDAKDLMVIYEENGKEWATYMKDILTSHLQSDRILLYNMDFEEEDILEHLTFSRYRCKLLVLTNYLLESLNEEKSRVLFQLLHPSCSTVILLCGVHSLEGFYESVPLDKDSHVIFTDQDQDYISVLSSIMDKGCYDTSDYSHESTSSEDTGLENREFVQIPKILMPFPLVLPQRILCENPGEICIILADEIPKNSAIEIEFCTEHRHVTRRYATQRNEKVLSVKAPDFPAGPVTINIWYGNTNKASMEIEYYTATREIKHLLMKVMDPIAFICQAFDVYSIEELDMVLTKSLQRKMFSREFNLYEISQHTNNGSCEEVPTLLHCAAKYGLKEVTLLLMQCQGADLISRITNKYGDDPAAIAEKHGHTHIQKIIQQFSRLKGTEDDIQVENLEEQPQDVYVGMGPCVEGFCEDRPQENLINGSKDVSQGNPVGDIKDKHELQHLHHNGSDEHLEQISKYVGNPVFFLKNEDLPDVVQGEKYITDTDADPLWVNIDK
ncbi:B-cell scaffold protein with ankyrin repeats-like [Spea bombifrons]|uniref:B-cell scaffold protein with ankyrin repeats-like n=1 Tax=Spea bombifrons TaxID=233779 RepID=UPI00234A13F4|nr:B-cell scaffold protein with ankyrin repeats-like [Spea bombifrons]